MTTAPPLARPGESRQATAPLRVKQGKSGQATTTTAPPPATQSQSDQATAAAGIDRHHCQAADEESS